jgi:hypothetical protein
VVRKNELEQTQHSRSLQVSTRTQHPLLSNLSEFSLAPPSPQNAWIIDELRRWESPPINFAKDQTPRHIEGWKTRYMEGWRILQKLAALPFAVPSCQPRREPKLIKHIEIIHTNTGHLNHKPNPLHVMEDLLRAREDGVHISTVNSILGGPADHISVGMMMTSLIFSGVGCRSDPVEEVTQIGALTIPTSSSGLGTVDILPERFKVCTKTVYERTVCKQRNAEKKKSKKMPLVQPFEVPLWASCIVPVGAITSPHTDYSGCSQLIQHIQGRKLWLCWPPTPHNLDTYLRKRLSGSIGLSTEDAIDLLQDMELLLLDEEQTCFTLPGGTIHAVVTLTPSCHIGLKLWRVEDLEVARAMSKIQLEHMNQRITLDRSTFDFCQNYFADLKGEVEYWKELERKNAEDNEKICRWISESEEMLKHIDDHLLCKQPNLGTN